MAASGKAGGSYNCDLANSNVKQLLRNPSGSCSEIKRLCHNGDVIVFTDIVDRKVKTFDPRSTTVEPLMNGLKLYVQRPRSDLLRSSFSHRASLLWNNLLMYLKSKPNVVSFKSALEAKSDILDNIKIKIALIYVIHNVCCLFPVNHQMLFYLMVMSIFKDTVYGVSAVSVQRPFRSLFSCIKVAR